MLHRLPQSQACVFSYLHSSGCLWFVSEQEKSALISLYQPLFEENSEHVLFLLLLQSYGSSNRSKTILRWKRRKELKMRVNKGKEKEKGREGEGREKNQPTANLIKSIETTIYINIMLTVYIEHWGVIWIFQLIFFSVMSLVSSHTTRSYTSDFFSLNVNLCPLVNAQRRCHRETRGGGWNPGSIGSTGNGPGCASAGWGGQETISSLLRLTGVHWFSLEAYQNHDLPLPK